jgi:hypothetical protein
MVHCINLVLLSKFLFCGLMPASSNFIDLLAICLPSSLFSCHHCSLLFVLIVLYIHTADFSSHFYLFLYFMLPINSVVDLGVSYRRVGYPSIHP